MLLNACALLVCSAWLRGLDRQSVRPTEIQTHIPVAAAQARTSDFSVIAFVTTDVKRVTIAAATMLAATRQPKRI